MLEGNPEFVLLDDQKVFYEKARRLAILSHTDKKKRVYRDIAAMSASPQWFVVIEIKVDDRGFSVQISKTNEYAVVSKMPATGENNRLSLLDTGTA